MTAATQARITISYGQLCVFDPALQAPYNDWSDAHVAQGFSWRPGSVSFAAEDCETSVILEVHDAEIAPDLTTVESAIRVPFEASASGKVEVGSVASGFEAPLRRGSYALYHLAPRVPGWPHRLVFVPVQHVTPAVLKDGPRAKRQERYLMTATPA